MAKYRDPRMGYIKNGVPHCYCGSGAMSLSKRRYNNRIVPVFECSDVICQTIVIARADGSPGGIPAHPDIRAARKRAHEVFDQVWRGEKRKMRRGDAYKWMSRTLGYKEAHIGMLDDAQCSTLIRAVLSTWPDLEL